MITKGFQALFLDMGMGKTPTTLVYIKHLLDKGLIRKALVVAPLRVAQSTWPQEVEKWEQFSDLRIVSCCGNEKKRREAFNQDADIYTINRENMVWMVENINLAEFDLLVIDELSSFKSVNRTMVTLPTGKTIGMLGSKRFIALKQAIDRGHFKYRIGLTGTPVPNNYLELWPQMYLLDQGRTLGTNFYEFRNKYFFENVYRCTWNPKKGAVSKINNKLDKIAVSLKAEDYLEMPEKIVNDIWLTMSPAMKKRYEALKDTWVDEDTHITTGNITQKLTQMASGFLYDGPSNGSEYEAHQVHTMLLDALEDILEFSNDNILCFCNFKYEMDLIIKKFGKAYTVVKLDNVSKIEQWNKGEIKLAIAHPASIGHGLNLQSGGSTIVWYGLNPSSELYLQANCRLYRQGQTSKSVVIHRLLVRDTIHERIVELLDGKITQQDLLREAVKMWEYTGVDMPPLDRRRERVYA